MVSPKMGAFVSFACLLLLSCFFIGLDARYLPTRSGNTEDRLSKLKELLRDGIVPATHINLTQPEYWVGSNVKSALMLLESEMDDYNALGSVYPRQQP